MEYLVTILALLILGSVGIWAISSLILAKLKLSEERGADRSDISANDNLKSSQTSVGGLSFHQTNSDTPSRDITTHFNSETADPLWGRKQGGEMITHQLETSVRRVKNPFSMLEIHGRPKLRAVRVRLLWFKIGIAAVFLLELAGYTRLFQQLFESMFISDATKSDPTSPIWGWIIGAVFGVIYATLMAIAEMSVITAALHKMGTLKKWLSVGGRVALAIASAYVAADALTVEAFSPDIDNEIAARVAKEKRRNLTDAQAFTGNQLAGQMQSAAAVIDKLEAPASPALQRARLDFNKYRVCIETCGRQKACLVRNKCGGNYDTVKGLQDDAQLLVANLEQQAQAAQEKLRGEALGNILAGQAGLTQQVVQQEKQYSFMQRRRILTKLAQEDSALYADSLKLHALFLLAPFILLILKLTEPPEVRRYFDSDEQTVAAMFSVDPSEDEQALINDARNRLMAGGPNMVAGPLLEEYFLTQLAAALLVHNDWLEYELLTVRHAATQQKKWEAARRVRQEAFRRWKEVQGLLIVLKIYDGRHKEPLPWSESLGVPDPRKTVPLALGQYAQELAVPPPANMAVPPTSDGGKVVALHRPA